MADKQLREDVINQIAKVIYDGNKAGLDGLRIAERTFPGTPGEVLGEALYVAESQITEEWWRQVEATIDGEAIRKAVVAIAEGSE